MCDHHFAGAPTQDVQEVKVVRIELVSEMITADNFINSNTLRAAAGRGKPGLMVALQTGQAKCFRVHSITSGLAPASLKTLASSCGGM